MKVAIMGAGLSGLSCAITLERHGITPTIFEKRSRPGDRFVNGEIMLSILNRPVDDSIAYLSEKHGIYIKPIANLKRMILRSENERAVLNGKLGFSTMRGRDSDSLESQLARQVNSKIVFNSEIPYEELLQEYTHVVMATGDAAYADILQDYQKDITVTLKGAVVEGEFDPHEVGAWLDNRFAPKGYGYIIPFSASEANIVIAYPDYPENRPMDIEDQWELFYHIACSDLKQELKITDRFEVTRYIIGICKYPRIGNTFFTGNCFGSIMPMFGFGQFAAILTGIYAAFDICGLGKYEDLTRHIRHSYNNSLTLRRCLEQLDNSKLDTVVKSLKGKLGDKIFDTKTRDPLKLASYLLKPLAWGKGRRV